MKARTYWPILMIVFLVGITGIVLAEPGPEPPLKETCGESVYGESGGTSVRQLKVKISITPKERQVIPGQTDIFLVCISNPKTNNKTVNPLITFIINTSKKNRAYVIGRHFAIPTDNHVGELPFNEPKENGRGRDVAPGEISPGETIQYTVITTRIRETRVHEISVAVEVPIFPNNKLQYLHYEKNSYLTVNCPFSCTVSKVADAIISFLKEYGGIIIIILTALTLLVMIIGPERIRSTISDLTNGD